MVISTGTTLPRIDSVWALYALQKSMMLTPCGPRAVPTGGAGVAAPAWSCTLTSAAIFFLGGIPCSSLSRGHDGAGAPATCCFNAVRLGVHSLTGSALALPGRRGLSSHRVSRRSTHSLASLRECL